MAEFLDDIARLLASPTSRRKAFQLIGGALAGAVVASFGATPVHAAACSKSEIAQGKKSCGQGRNATCCGAGQCCAGSSGECCSKGQCVCGNGTCAASDSQGNCPGGCKLCS